MIDNNFLPVDFLPFCVAMAPYAERAAALMGAKVALVYVFDLMSHNGFELIVTPLPDIEEQHRNIARSMLDLLLKSEFPACSSKSSITVTSQLHSSHHQKGLKGWNFAFPGAPLLDRLTHHAEVPLIEGTSYRLCGAFAPSIK
ncbi:MAG: hypothetical protein KGM47_01275 [Acidobacteriota bacterium]|nr:hypothetical protein [Acidobacteriota bacterium]